METISRKDAEILFDEFLSDLYSIGELAYFLDPDWFHMKREEWKRDENVQVEGEE